MWNWRVLGKIRMLSNSVAVRYTRQYHASRDEYPCFVRGVRSIVGGGWRNAARRLI